jgi:glycosyltransferase involved in cell wall biosynthesis
MKSIALTPVRNEEWILDLFLRRTLKHFDHVIVLDQASTDNTAQIARSYDRVDYLLNSDTAYDERARKVRLLAECRRRYGIGNIVFALDADELVTFASGTQAKLDELAMHPPGTPINVEKPTPLPGCEYVIRYPQPTLLGTVDAGIDHSGSFIHCERVPCIQTLPAVVPEGMKVVHSCFLRPKVLQSRLRWYAMLENLRRHSSFAHRLLRYRNDEMSRHIRDMDVESVDTSGLGQDSELFNELRNVTDLDWNWHDLAVLELFQKHGTKRFWLDDIWAFDWKGFVKTNRGGILPADTPIPETPPWPVDLVRKCLIHSFDWLMSAKRCLTQTI